MDYKTKPMKRKTARVLSKILRQLFGVPPDGPFPIVQILDRIKDVFKNCTYEVVDDDELGINNPCSCYQNEIGGFTIRIKESVYYRAHKYNTGAYRDHITHELCHVFLFKIGYTPIVDRSYGNGQLRAYESVEWQAKALCGELMMPYDETAGMSVYEIKTIYGVSEEQARYRLKY